MFHCIFALWQADFFGELAREGKVDLFRFAKEKQLDAAKLEAIARYLYGLGILERDAEDRYYATFAVPADGWPMLEILYAYDPVFHNLPALLRKQKRYGRDLSRSIELDVQATAKICRKSCFDTLVEVIEQKQARRILDLGCGSAELLIQLSNRNSDLRCYGVDIAPEAVHLAKRRIREAGLEWQVTVGIGDVFAPDQWDFLTPAEKGNVDLIVSASVFHEFAYRGTKRLTHALRRMRQEFSGVELVLFEVVEQSDESLKVNRSDALEHHLFHRLSEQGIASLKQWQMAFVRAGYSLNETVVSANTAVISLRDQ